MVTGSIELYDLSKDLGKTYDVAKQHADLVAKAAKMMDKAHTPHPSWKSRGRSNKYISNQVSSP